MVDWVLFNETGEGKNMTGGLSHNAQQELGKEPFDIDLTEKRGGISKPVWDSRDHSLDRTKGIRHDFSAEYKKNR